MYAPTKCAREGMPFQRHKVQRMSDIKFQGYWSRFAKFTPKSKFERKIYKLDARKVIPDDLDKYVEDCLRDAKKDYMENHMIVKLN